MTEGASTSQSLFELGKLYCDRGDFGIAIDKLKAAAELFYSEQDFQSYFKSVNLLLRMYAEMEDHASIDQLKSILDERFVKNKIELSSRCYYSLGLCAAYKGQFKEAQELLEKALSLALAADEKENVCYAISGLSIVYTALGKYEEALKEIYNLQVFFQVMPLPELELSAKMQNGHILRRLGKFDQALEIFWQCYDMLKVHKNLYMYVSLLYAMGITYADAGDKNMARMYLNLAKRSVDKDNMKYCDRVINQRLEELGGRSEAQYDIIFDQASKSVLEQKKGRIDFKNQFILLDMLRLFLRHPGEVYSKEALVKKVWKQEYDPRVHDNKIYVTIKRLRKMIEPDYDKPKYIFRAKNGYYLNRNTRVLLD